MVRLRSPRATQRWLTRVVHQKSVWVPYRLIPCQDFDDWAPTYDDRILVTNRGFPFEKYNQVLSTVLHTAQSRRPGKRCSTWAGTGNLTATVTWLAAGCGAPTIPARCWPWRGTPAGDLCAGGYPRSLANGNSTDIQLHRFRLCVSSFRYGRQGAVNPRSAVNHLVPDGRIVIADIAFRQPRGSRSGTPLRGKTNGMENCTGWVKMNCRLYMLLGCKPAFEPVSRYAGVFRIVQR